MLLERNALATIAPHYQHTPTPGEQYRWTTHISLPYPFPSKRCYSKVVSIAERNFEFAIHNHFDRIFLGSRNAKAWPRISLADTRRKDLSLKQKLLGREILQSVAVFNELTEYSTPNDAFADASKKIEACFNHLSNFLSKCQSAAPYLVAWQIYPISLFDVGTVYHSILHRHSSNEKWHICASAPAISMARRLRSPSFFMDVPDEDVDDSSSDTSLIQASNELLAEAQMSLFRGLPRLTILNSYGAVETLANIVFKKKRLEMLTSNNVPTELAEEYSESERRNHRTEPNFLYHVGLKSACNRSLFEENQEKYEDLLKLQQLRHRVAHGGYKPTSKEAESGHRLACECVVWLADVGGFPAKAMVPGFEATPSQFGFESQDAHAVSAAEIQFLKHAFGLFPADENGSKSSSEMNSDEAESGEQE